MQVYGEQLRAESIEVLSLWSDLNSPSSDGFAGIDHERRSMDAMLRIQQLSASNALVLFVGDLADCGRAEFQVELGVAIALGKRLLMVGQPWNCFHDLPDVERFAAWPECFSRILELGGTDAMTTRQAALEMNATTAQVLRRITLGDLPAVKRDGRWVVGRNDVDRLKAQLRRAAAEAAAAE